MATSNPARGRTTKSKQLASSSTASTRAKQAASTNKSLVTQTPSASSTSSLKAFERVNKSRTRGPSTRSASDIELNLPKSKSNLSVPSKPPAPAVAASIEEAPSGRSASTVETTHKPNVVKSKPDLSSSVKAPAHVAPQPIEEKAPALTSDPLQVAAQLYPWLYMTSTLEACFETAEAAAEKDLAARSQQLTQEESEMAEQRSRFLAERTADFYDQLCSDTLAETAPQIMQTFLAHGDACTRVEAKALHLATHGASEPEEDAPLQVYVAMLETLDELHNEAVQLEASILKLTTLESNYAPVGDPESAVVDEDGKLHNKDPKEDISSKSDERQPYSTASSSARIQVVGVFAACLPVLRARISNLSMAQELIDSAQENLSISLRMESLGLLD